MKRMLLSVSFDGTAYHGWQVQPNGITVQETIGNCLKKVLGQKTDVTGCSRTDAGVHANQFCMHFDCDESIPEKAFLLGLNSVLPDDIRVIGCQEVKSDFHARYDCMGKEYIYNFYTGVQSPFKNRYALFLSKEPDIDLMNDFCKSLIGKNDFEGFSCSARTVDDTVRTVKYCEVSKIANDIILKIAADGFLYNMVRIIAGTALAVGYGKINPNIAEVVFNTKNRSFAGDTLAAKALFLNKVFYPKDV